LIRAGIAFPYVHDLAELLTLLAQSGLRVPDSIKGAKRLTEYAVVTRYPGVVGPVTEDDYLKAVEIATEVVRWAEAEFE